ncbi:hypothetical protein AAG906_000781 [Vitis piasezkii]
MWCSSCCTLPLLRTFLPSSDGCRLAGPMVPKMVTCLGKPFDIGGLNYDFIEYPLGDTFIQLNMEQKNFKVSVMTSNVRHLHDQQKLETFGNLKNSFDCYGKYSHGNTEIEKQEHESDPEINSYEAVSLTEMEIKCLNYDYVSSSDCITTDANNSKQLCSAVSTSRSSTVGVGIYKHGGAEGTSGEMVCNKVVPSSTCQNRFAGNECSNDGETSAHFIGGIDSVQQICINSGIKLETGQPLKKEVNELDLGRRKGNLLNADEDVLKSIVQATFHDKQLKTESSSSNSSHVFLPASSNDSCQEPSLDVKSCKHSKSSGMNSFCTPFKCSLEESAGKTMVLGTKAQVASREVLDSSIFLPRKQGNVGKASETVGNVSERGGERVLGMIADLMVQRIDVPNSSLLKTKNEELASRGKLELPCEVDDGLEVASGVAREMEPEVSIYRRPQEARFRQERKLVIYLIETEPRSKSYNVQVKSENLYSTKVMGEDPKLSMKNQQLCIEVKEQSQDRGLGTCQANDGLCGRGSSPLTTPKDVVGGGFDLNEGILADEVEYPKQLVNETSSSCHVVNVSAPIPVVAKSRVPLCLPMPPLQFEGQLCWKGSAATSAFRPASVSHSPNKRKALSNSDDNHSSRHSQGLKGFDLNVAAEESSLEVSPKRAERPNLDLNCLSEDDNCEAAPLVSLPRNSIRDIDLNHNQWFEDTCEDAQDSGQGSQLLRGSAMDPAVSCTGNVRQPGASVVKPAQPAYRADLSSKQGFNPHGTAVIPHALVSSTPPAFPMAPHLVNVAGGPGPCDVAIIRHSLDLNGGVGSENGSRGGNAAQLFVPVGNSLVQEQMKSFQQFALPATPIKRREPDGGWDCHQLGYRQ